MKVLSLYNIKGGVGKTTFAVNLAYGAAQSGRRTLLWDLDPQGSSSYILRVKPRLKGSLSRLAASKSSVEKSLKETQWPYLDLLPADFELRNLSGILKELKNETTRMTKTVKLLGHRYDLVVVDSAPEASLVSENVLNFSDLVLVPVIPNALSLNTFNVLGKFAATTHRKHRPPIKAAFNMVDRRKNLHKELLDEYLGTDSRFFRSQIPISSAVEQMASVRAPLQTFKPRSQPALAFSQLTSEVLSVI